MFVYQNRRVDFDDFWGGDVDKKPDGIYWAG